MKPTKILLFSLLSLTFLLGGCAKQNAMIEAHNSLASIESSMIDQYNGATLIIEQAEAISSAIRRLQRIDIKNCPQDYQNAWDNVIDHWIKWERALQSEDISSADTLCDMHPLIVEKLNSIAESHGLVIYR